MSVDAPQPQQRHSCRYHLSNAVDLRDPLVGFATGWYLILIWTHVQSVQEMMHETHG